LNSSWRIEKDEGSEASLSEGAQGEVEFAYTLRSSARASQFVALATDLTDAPAFEALTFSIRSAAPRRVSVQLRFARDDQARWGKSVYVDTRQRVISVPANQLRRADGPAERPPLQRATSLLFVVDLTNAKPGDSGKFAIGNVRLLR
jgi:hypothetical protein